MPLPSPPSPVPADWRPALPHVAVGSALVVAGGLALIAALVVFAVGARRGGRRVRARWVSMAYDVGVLVLLVSVAIGVGLAPGPP